MAGIEIPTTSPRDAEMAERERCAKLLEALMAEVPWRDKQWARCALAVAARAIRRGRRLTDQEKLNNLANSMEEADAETGSKELAPFVAELRRVASRLSEEETAMPLSRLEKENDLFREALWQIAQWAKAYPLKVFPEPDFAKARDLLAAGGITLDAVSASNMRHVVESVGRIAQTALDSADGVHGQSQRKESE